MNLKIKESIEKFESKYGLPDGFKKEEQLSFAAGAVSSIENEDILDVFPIWTSRNGFDDNNILFKVHGIFIITKKWMFVTSLKRNKFSILNRKEFKYRKWLVTNFKSSQTRIEKSFGRSKIIIFHDRNINFSFAEKAFPYVNKIMQKYELKNAELFLMRERAENLDIEVHKTMGLDEIKNMIQKKDRNKELRLDHEAGVLKADLYQKGANIELTKAKAERFRKDGPLIGGNSTNINIGNELLGLNESIDSGSKDLLGMEKPRKEKLKNINEIIKKKKK